MIKMKLLIDFNNLPDNLLIKLKDKFRKELFKEFYSKFNNIEECTNYLDCLISSFYKYKHQHYFIPVKTVRKMIQICNICNISTKKINESILFIKKRNGTPIRIRLPFYPSPELSNIIGHVFGDGHIDNGGRVSYTNKEKRLIEKFKNNIEKTFGIKTPYERTKGKNKDCFEIRYPSVIGELLILCGAVKGNKTKTKFDVPKWIKHGEKNIKILFIRALFDDESTVSKRKSIRINLTKDIAKINSLVKFFQSIKYMLSKLGIKSNKILVSRDTMTQKRRRKLLFFITGYENLILFFEIIGFDHPLKTKKLRNQLFTYRDSIEDYLEYGNFQSILNHKNNPQDKNTKCALT